MNRYLYLKEKTKLRFAVLLFDIIKKMYPGDNVDMSIHNIDFRILNKTKWVIEPLPSSNGYTAKRRDCELFDITLFEKEK